MTRRLILLLGVGASAIAAASTGALLTLRGSTAPPPVSPTWNLFDDAQWTSIGAQLPGFDLSTLHVVTATPPQLAIVAAKRADGRTCFAVVRRTAVARPICRLAQPLLAFTTVHGRHVDIVGLARHDVATVVLTAGGIRQGGALLPAGPASAFGYGFAESPVLEGLDGNGRVITRLYCASALRGVCGVSAQRRS